MTVIIAILSAIIGPALYNSKAAARTATCAFNLHQTGIGVATYVQDFDGFYPQTKAYSTQTPQIDDAAGAIEFPDRGSPLSNLGAYTTGLVECPSDPDPDGTACLNSPFAAKSYLVNGYFVWGINENQVSSSAETVFVAERRSGSVGIIPPDCDVIFHPWYNSTNPLAPKNDMDPKIGAIDTTRHLGAANYLFVDDHCKALEFEQVWRSPDSNLMTP